MDAFSKNKYLFWAVIILAVMNIALMSLMWFGDSMRMPDWRPRMPAPPHAGPERLHAMDFIRHELKLNEEQQQKFSSLTEEHIGKMKSTLDKIGEKRKALMDAALSIETDSVKLMVLADEIGGLHSELEIINIEHFNKLKNICSPEQIEKLKKIMGEIIKFKPYPGGAFRKPGEPEPFRREGRFE